NSKDAILWTSTSICSRKSTAVESNVVENRSRPLAFLPDRIAVMDTSARSEMIAEGIPADRAFVTGQPRFDELDPCRSHFSPQRRAELRARLGIVPDEKLVLFASQPSSVLLGTNPAEPRYPGYTE